LGTQQIEKTCKLVLERLVVVVVESGTLMENKVQWIILKGLLGGDLGAANIYAPNNVREWCFRWAEMIQKLLNGYKWIFCWRLEYGGVA
jgi:hypothetical protein